MTLTGLSVLAHALLTESSENRLKPGLHTVSFANIRHVYVRNVNGFPEMVIIYPGAHERRSFVASGRGIDEYIYELITGEIVSGSRRTGSSYIGDENNYVCIIFLAISDYNISTTQSVI